MGPPGKPKTTSTPAPSSTSTRTSAVRLVVGSAESPESAARSMSGSGRSYVPISSLLASPRRAGHRQAQLFEDRGHIDRLAQHAARTGRTRGLFQLAGHAPARDDHG